jgi:hypothetical protein
MSAAAYLDHSLVDAEMGVGLEVDAVVLLQRSRRLYPRCRRRLPGGGGEARATAPEGGVAVEVRWQHGEMMRREERTERLGGDFWAESEGALGCRLPPCASAFPSWGGFSKARSKLLGREKLKFTSHNHLISANLQSVVFSFYEVIFSLSVLFYFSL